MSTDVATNNAEISTELSVSSMKLTQLIATVYGPYAFGVVSLLIVWYTIVGPQLDRQAVDYQENEKHIKALQDVSTSMETISRSMERTAMVLEGIVDRMEKLK